MTFQESSYPGAVVIAAVIFAIFAQQAGADEDLHRVSFSLHNIFV